MKRKIALYGILVAVIIGAMPYLTGILVENKFKDVILVLEEIDSLPASIKLLDYQRGWRKSTAQTQVTIFNNRSNKQYALILEHEIRHGPFVQSKDNDYKNWHFARALVHSKLLINEEAKKILLTEVGQTELIHIRGEIAMDGVVRIHVDSPTLKLKEQANTERTAWKGLQGEWVLSANLKRLTGSVHLPGFDFDLNNTRILIENLTYTNDLNKFEQGLWPGTFTAKVDNLVFEDQSNNLKVNIDNAKTTGTMAMKETLAFLSGGFTIDKLMINNQEFGPVIYSNSLKNIDHNVIRSFLVLNRQIKVNQGSLQNLFLQFFISILPDLFKTRPEFHIDKLQIHTAQGDITGTLAIAAGGENANKNTMQILQSVAASASFAIPKLILRELLVFEYTKEANLINENAKRLNAAQGASTTPESSATAPALSKVLTDAEISQDVANKVNTTITKWLNQGMILEKDQYYVTNIEVNQGRFVVNGHEVGLPA